MRPDKRINHADGWGYYWVHPTDSRAHTDIKVALWVPARDSWFFVGDEKAHPEDAVDRIVGHISLPGSLM